MDGQGNLLIVAKKIPNLSHQFFTFLHLVTLYTYLHIFIDLILSSPSLRYRDSNCCRLEFRGTAGRVRFSCSLPT